MDWSLKKILQRREGNLPPIDCTAFRNSTLYFIREKALKAHDELRHLDHDVLCQMLEDENLFDFFYTRAVKNRFWKTAFGNSFPKTVFQNGLRRAEASRSFRRNVSATKTIFPNNQPLANQRHAPDDPCT